MALTGVDHKRLVEAHLDGDQDAFAAIVRAYYEGLFAHAMRRTGEAHAAEDAVQETLARAYRALPNFNGEYEMRAWLHRILTNVCHDEGRRRRRESQTFERVAATYSEVPAVDHDLAALHLPRREVLDALAALPASYRDALVLRYVKELSFHDVAEVSGISEGNARLRVHRGRAALRRALAPFAGVILFLAPFLRRGQRAALAAQVGAESHLGMASGPVAVRVAESGMTIVDKAPSLPSVIGVAASLVVPAALPVLGEHLVTPATRPPAAVAAPFDEETAAPDQEGTDPSGEPAAALPAVAEASVATTTIPPEPGTTTTLLPMVTFDTELLSAPKAKAQPADGTSDRKAHPGSRAGASDPEEEEAPDTSTIDTGPVGWTSDEEDDEDEAAPDPTDVAEEGDAEPADAGQGPSDGTVDDEVSSPAEPPAEPPDAGDGDGDVSPPSTVPTPDTTVPPPAARPSDALEPAAPSDAPEEPSTY